MLALKIWIVSFVSCSHHNYPPFNSHSHNSFRIVSTPLFIFTCLNYSLCSFEYICGKYYIRLWKNNSWHVRINIKSNILNYCLTFSHFTLKETVIWCNVWQQWLQHYIWNVRRSRSYLPHWTDINIQYNSALKREFHLLFTDAYVLRQYFGKM